MNYSQSGDDNTSVNHSDHNKTNSALSTDNLIKDYDDVNDLSVDSLVKFDISTTTKDSNENGNRSSHNLNSGNHQYSHKDISSEDEIITESIEVPTQQTSVGLITTPKRKIKRKNTKEESESVSFFSTHPENKESNHNVFPGINIPPFTLDVENLSSSEKVQHRIIEYLSTSMNNLIFQFKNDLLEILEQKDIINPVTKRFLLTLNAEIKRSIQTYFNRIDSEYNDQILNAELMNMESQFKNDFAFEIPQSINRINHESLIPIINDSLKTKKYINQVFNETQAGLQNLINERDESIKKLKKLNKNHRSEFRRLQYQEKFLIEKRYDQLWRSRFIQKRREDYQHKRIMLQSSLQIQQNNLFALFRSKEKIKESRYYLFDNEIGIVTSMKRLIKECEELKKLRCSISLKNDLFNDNLLYYKSLNFQPGFHENNATLFSIPISPIHAISH